MKVGSKLISTIIALILALGLLIVGVMAASTGIVNFNGTVSFIAEDVHAKVIGNISGTAPGDDIELKDLEFNASSDENKDPLKSNLLTWQNKILNFANKNSKIEIEIKVQNISKERKLNVKIEDEVDEVNNVIKKIIYNDKDYTGDTITLDPSTDTTTSEEIFTIQMTIDNKNNSVNGVEYEYKVYLENYDSANQSVETKYNVDIKFTDPFSGDYSALTKSENPPIENPGANVYQIENDGLVLAYVDSGEYDILFPISSGKEVTFKIYVSVMSDLVFYVNEEMVNTDVGNDESYTYTIYTFTQTINSNISIVAEGELADIY